MRLILVSLAEKLNARIDQLNADRHRDSLPSIQFATVTLLGQIGLSVQPLARQLTINATRDVDALLEGDHHLRAVLKEVLRDLGYEYDDLSSEAWMPQDATKVTLFESQYLRIQAFDAESILVRKAVKAPQKNKQLLLEAITVLGEPFLKRVAAHGGNLNKLLEHHHE